MTIRRTWSCALLGALVLFALPAFGQTYPNKPVRVVVPFAAGGPSDVVARLLATKLQEKWGQQLVIENVVGASGNIGTRAVARAAPDGYTILVTTSGFVVNPSLYASKPYDAVTEFTPITMPVQAPNVLVVHPSVEAKSVKELIELIKANPGKYSYASAGVGQTGHLAGEFLKLKYGLDITHVPFNGGGPIMNSMMGGHTLIAFLGLPSAAAFIKSGKVNGLMVTTPKRSPAVPDVPTAREAGVPEHETVFFQGVLAPAGTPKEIVEKWHSDIAEVIAMPDVKQKLEASSYVVGANTPAEFSEFIKAEVAQWQKVIEETKLPKVQ